MTFNIKMSDYYCMPSEFVVNGIEADAYDFGMSHDACPGNAEDYGCGNRVFEPDPPSQEVLDKYHITEAEYKEISDELVEKLSVGACSCCV